MDINTTAHAVFEDLQRSKYICSDRKRVACVWKYVFYHIYNAFISKDQWKCHFPPGKTCWCWFHVLPWFPRTTQRRTIFVSLSFCSLTVNVWSHHTRLILYSTLHAFHYTDEDQTEILDQPCRTYTTLSHATFILNDGIYLFFIIYSLSCWS